MKVEDVKKVGVVGAGTMGSGIAQVVASNRRDVILLDVSDSALDRGMKAIGNSLGRLVKKGDIKEEDSKSILSRIKTSTKFEDLADTDLVIEAVFEDLNVKKETFKKLDATTRPDIMLATNTSSLPIIEIAVITKRPDKVIGMHFFNPVPLMKLVEIIKSLATSEETVQFAYDFAMALGKEPVNAKDVPGFIVNRVLMPMLNEAVFALEEGVGTPEDIDKAMKLGTNQPIGPLALIDLIGLDVTLDVIDVLYREFKDPKFRAAPLLRQMVRAGWLGRKTGRGFYKY
ncbi:MAG: 3-hydroxybutyryl-CoA dehydrogenase, 3-hydroxybutyryl-CoA dehydrogenase [Candidatus Dadabacteria bacterium CSP1-2]|nr:MAG: 3-hydroxybutyryl-CoA dehydrogenase, 3-hydroxybutyryl-CoA dehydrogenase [Candidatus Dadabacteria bacterium CSP1-2]MBF8302549.1 3-hydroxybutyryl-CoA dehydrogenase [Candidatus Dadabacteria bacterium]